MHLDAVVQFDIKVDDILECLVFGRHNSVSFQYRTVKKQRSTVPVFQNKTTAEWIHGSTTTSLIICILVA